MDDPRQLITMRARARGFEQIRFASVGPTPNLSAFQEWIAAGNHADLGWMQTGSDVRGDPRVRLGSAQTAVVMSMTHGHRRPPDPGGRTGIVARYAWGRDYHNLMGKKLRKLRADLRQDGIASWGGVDTAPIIERAWAASAGLGFSGKNSMQILTGSTSWFFLAVLFVDVPVPPDLPRGDHCGSCTRCLVACPTQAFVGPRQLDSRRCISYWTIEAKGLPPAQLRPGFGRWVFGCDICQEVCPHNHDPPEPEQADFAPRHAWLNLDDVLATPDDALMERFIGTPLRRPKAAGLKRNAAIALGNLKDPGAIPSLEFHGLRHDSPIVRGASVWALKRLEAPIPDFDSNPIVQAEIERP